MADRDDPKTRADRLRDLMDQFRVKTEDVPQHAHDVQERAGRRARQAKAPLTRAKRNLKRVKSKPKA